MIYLYIKVNLSSFSKYQTFPKAALSSATIFPGMFMEVPVCVNHAKIKVPKKKNKNKNKKTKTKTKTKTNKPTHI